MKQRIDPGMVPDDKLDKLMAYAIKSETHLWIATTAFQVSEQVLDAMATEPIHMDAENMVMMPALGCFVCEEPYHPRLRHRRCPGEPRQ